MTTTGPETSGQAGREVAVEGPGEPVVLIQTALLADEFLPLACRPALDGFLNRLIGHDWPAAIEQAVPGGPHQMERDVETFFDTDLPALLAWRFTAQDANRITQPVLHIGGADSGPLFAEIRELMLALQPQAEDVLIPGTATPSSWQPPTAHTAPPTWLAGGRPDSQPSMVGRPCRLPHHLSDVFLLHGRPPSCSSRPSWRSRGSDGASCRLPA